MGFSFWLRSILCLLIMLSFAAACSSSEEKLPQGARELTFEIKAKQFVWQVKHPGADGQLDTEDDLFLENQIVLPEKTRVHLQLESLDVIHGFWLPSRSLRLTLIPGKKYEASLDFVKTGKFRLACSENCGVGHSHMIGWLVVLDQESYQSWLTSQKK
ncbi:MAG: cytochrome c oxidase subunit II [Deltaproteobacteria bacterium]|nr:cytochrome c oxidase subunit II [Deltaproteobacteria bacterium]